MIRRSQLLGFATIFLVGCGGTSTTTQSAAPAATGTAPSGPALASAAPPLVKPLSPVMVPAVPGLVSQTNAKARANSVTVGRVDPFATVQSGPSVIPVVAIAPTKPRLPVAAGPSRIPVTMPHSSRNPLPLPNLSTAPVGTSVPPVTLPLVPPPSPTAMAERINITGVVQIQNKWHVIVQESPTGTSRHVRAGDTLAGGQVLVKRVIAGADPVVVLQQNGKELTRRVGSGLSSNV
jgi:hypothetical protein